MVGLMDLGEVAWEIEQVLNLWLEQKWPASPDLLDLIALGSRSFAGWVAQLRDGSLTQEIEATALVDLAVRLKQVETPAPVSVPMAIPAPAAQPAAPAEPAPAAVERTAAPAAAEPTLDFIVEGQGAAAQVPPAPETQEPAPEARPIPPAERTAPPPPPDVQVGEVRVAPHLFDIYLKEAFQHVAALEAHAVAWRAAAGSEVSPEFLRAAHTLASSSRTTGFEPLAALAGALEQWTRHARFTTAAADVGAVVAAIEGLRERVEAVARREPCAPADALEGGLRALSARLLAPKPLPKAPPPREAKSGREQRVLQDDIDAQLLPVFLEEAQQLLPQIGADLRDWKAKPDDAQVSRSLQRALHTLKGSARMAGAIRLGELTHLMESRIEAAQEAGDVGAALFGELEQKLDRLSLDLERMQYAPEPAAAAPVEAPRAEAPLPSPSAMLRVNADVLDQLINESGEVSIARTRVEAELRAVKQSIVDLSESVARLRGQLREVEVQADSQMQSRATELEQRNREFDPLEFDRYTRLQELTRLMAESLHDATSIQQTLAKSLGDADGALAHQSRVSRDVQQALMRMRAVPFANLNERLYRIVRQTARELGKSAELDIQGSQVEVDRSVLERIGAPLEHMLRNALAHGLEAPAARAAAGKPAIGRISVALRQEANEIALTVSDDGAGLDLDKLRRRAEARGLLAAEALASDAEAAQLIFVSGLSTADEVTELAGRGVGMDVVRSEIGAIGGRVEIATAQGRGTTFTVYLPLTLAVTQAVLVRAGGAACAVPSAMVEQVLRLKSDAMAARFAGGAIEFQERSYPLYDLTRLQGGAAEAIAPGYHSVLLLRGGAQRIALHVDELLGNQEIVVKAIGPQLARVPGISGATVLADGRIALIVNPVQLVQRARGAPLREMAPPAAAGAAPLILVVDDSLTVRKITGRLLEREGYRVLAAKDGLDALEMMKDLLPAVMLVDIEMPRMDGFDLTRTVRADPRTRDIPIIMISSRTAGKHRDQAMQLGVNAFLGKPYPEVELLQHISGFLELQKAQVA
jgi:chemosensory pili system protein ChpA (sensor histidine kinase/response regulator)